jgi:AcrR family transcriptional regulator
MADVPARSWREQAVTRSLDTARARAETRVQRFLDAAFELMQEGESGKDFTVQEVVERSGQSLRSFYQYFGGKQELLLALFEEIVQATAEQVEARIGDTGDPGERLHRFVVEYYRVCRPAGRRGALKNGPTPAMAEFAQQLLTAQPADAAQAFSPLASLFEEVLGDATAAGVVRADLQIRGVTGIVLEAIMFNSFSATIAGLVSERDGTDPAEEL